MRTLSIEAGSRSSSILRSSVSKSQRRCQEADNVSSQRA